MGHFAVICGFSCLVLGDEMGARTNGGDNDSLAVGIADAAELEKYHRAFNVGREEILKPLEGTIKFVGRRKSWWESGSTNSCPRK